MSPEEIRGAETEKRFFSALSTRVPDTPEWLLKIRMSKPVEDIRGVDGYALIRLKDDPEPTRVPLQIKSSEAGRRHYQMEMPVLQAENVIIVVVTPEMDDETIRLATYAALLGSHNANKRYGWFHRELMTQRFSGKKREYLMGLSRQLRD